jgi:hypothetical protein
MMSPLPESLTVFILRLPGAAGINGPGSADWACAADELLGEIGQVPGVRIELVIRSAIPSGCQPERVHRRLEQSGADPRAAMAPGSGT